MSRSSVLPLVAALALPAVLHAQMPEPRAWLLSGELGYARTFQISGIDGSYQVEAQLVRATGSRLRPGIATGWFRLGDYSAVVNTPFQTTSRTERKRSGFFVTGILSWSLGRRAAIDVGAGTYAIRLEDALEVRDSTGALFRPATKTTTTDWGVGGSIGVSLEVLKIGRAAALGLTAKSHLTGIWEPSETGQGKSVTFIQFFTLGGRLSYRL